MKKWPSNYKPIIIDVSDEEQINYCGARAFMEILGSKWKFNIVSILMKSPKRYTEFLNAMPYASEKMIFTSLRELEEHKIIVRCYNNEMPQRVEYSLTDYGKTIKPILRSIEKWGNNHLETYPETVLFETKKKSAII